MQAAALPSLTIAPAVQSLWAPYTLCLLLPPSPGRSGFLLSLVLGYLHIPVLSLNPLGGPFITAHPFEPSERIQRVLTELPLSERKGFHRCTKTWVLAPLGLWLPCHPWILSTTFKCFFSSVSLISVLPRSLLRRLRTPISRIPGCRSWP